MPRGSSRPFLPLPLVIVIVIVISAWSHPEIAQRLRLREEEEEGPERPILCPFLTCRTAGSGALHQLVAHKSNVTAERIKLIRKGRRHFHPMNAFFNVV